jgi:hypothetical protein
MKKLLEDIGMQIAAMRAKDKELQQLQNAIGAKYKEMQQLHTAFDAKYKEMQQLLARGYLGAPPSLVGSPCPDAARRCWEHHLMCFKSM